MHKWAVSNSCLAKADAGRKGALIRNGLYGNPGTKEGRVKGGTLSVLVNRALSNNFKRLKIIKKQEPSENLAEFLGIMLGDGHLAKNQFIITLHVAEQAYYEYVFELINSLLNDIPSKYSRRNIIELCLSGRGYVVELERLGLQVGNKVLNKVSLPDWTKAEDSYSKAVLRGLFDTDGSIYLDKHTIKGITYRSVCAAYTSHSEALLLDVYQILRKLGFSPTNTSKWRIILRKCQEVVQFFKLIQPRNNKHQQRFQRFMEE